jgi:hypothetical protein
METTMKSGQIPKTDSIEELARFWDTHELTDFEDQLEEVKEPVFERRPEITLVLRLEPQEAEAVARIANDRGVERSELLREWVLEGLEGNRVRT